MKDYLMKMQAICDNVEACGRPVPEEDQVLSILAGLGPDYEPSVAVLTATSDSYNVRSASALLLASKKSSSTICPISASYVKLPHITKKPGTLTMEIHLLIEVIYGQQNHGNRSRDRGVPSKTNLYANFVVKVAMQFKNVIIALIFLYRT